MVFTDQLQAYVACDIILNAVPLIDHLRKPFLELLHREVAALPVIFSLILILIVYLRRRRLIPNHVSPIIGLTGHFPGASHLPDVCWLGLHLLLGCFLRRHFLLRGPLLDRTHRKLYLFYRAPVDSSMSTYI